MKREGAPTEDPRWNYSHVIPEHYSDCDMYSLLQHSKSPFDDAHGQEKTPWWKEHAAKIVVGVVIAFAGAIFKLLFG